MKILIAILMIVHGLITAAQSTASFRPEGGIANPVWLSWWPSGLGQSWMLTLLGIERSLPARAGGILWLAAGAALLAAGLALLGILPHEWWQSLAFGGAAISLGLLVIYLHPFYAIGVTASLVLLLALQSGPGSVLDRLGP